MSTDCVAERLAVEKNFNVRLFQETIGGTRLQKNPLYDDIK